MSQTPLIKQMVKQIEWKITVIHFPDNILKEFFNKHINEDMKDSLSQKARMTNTTLVLDHKGQTAIKLLQLNYEQTAVLTEK